MLRWLSIAHYIISSRAHRKWYHFNYIHVESRISSYRLRFNTKLTRRQVMIFRLPNRITTFKQRVYIPTNTIHQPDVVPMLVHRLRRWPNIGLIYRVCCPQTSHDTSTQCWSNVSSCLRRWPNIGPTLSSWNAFKKTLVMDDYFLCSMRLLFGRFQSRDEVG